ncbi:hypothetical protein EGH24_09040 [Halonotius terrestris]|uniref:Uncharacterized protein n=1 Tax=Halonotius terrestris TaxID=2487750 RepID=A0A8J8TCI1_9EURY|nr:hypothetical protein [Halonotius terrestris]TQQ81263.1 hypothetical protein EGH24_09040 [Halonotius terrestris]
MVYRWRSREANYTVWGANRDSMAEVIKSHLFEHSQQYLSHEDPGVSWECPYCDRSEISYDEDKTIQHFKDHLFEHEEQFVQSGSHVAEEIDRSGNILVKAPKNSPGLNNARMHFLAAGDIVILITTNPAARLRMLREELGSWPALTVVLTTKDDPAEDIKGLDISDVPIEIVKLSKKLGLSTLGKTISRVLEDHGNSEGQIVVEFDILSEIISKFGEKPTFKFLQILTNQFKTVDAIAYYTLDPDSVDPSTISLINDTFDLSITATETNFISDTE